MKFYNYTLVDQKICQLAATIETNILSYINPINLDEEKENFFNTLNKKEQYNPNFNYVAKNPIYKYYSKNITLPVFKNEMNELFKEIGSDSLGLIFERKLLDLFDRIELIKSVGTENFSENSQGYYGEITSNARKYAQEIISKKIEPKENTLTFEESKKIMESALHERKLKYKVIEKKTPGSKVSVNIRTKEIMISKKAQLSKMDLSRLIAHEIEGHIYRYENGCTQPYKIFSRGLSKETLKTEEGIAVYIEQQEEINIDKQLKQYAGRIIAIQTAKKHSFFETFEEMNKYFNKEESFNLTLRAKRGTFNQEKGGAFYKDSLYLQGYLEIKEFTKDRNLKELYYGRYSINDAPLVFDVDGLIKPKYFPKVKKWIH